ncbi:hypothetical protein MIMGU_mgv1a008967mg [Erythranthe guttata]|uniref:Enoyl reductase (ER) domain-containing protein n=1 Tax=Erythranthe guttata TaxID=4155 RepID=A0A022R7W4_ERYGU|nr:PREDICTED: NADP-dependent alkenal double bond reductase P1-like [Erythranthe guttata]EYU35823.1 hypothetical protein MIMGU_mgv1a008967mg [Erythranthe guttata]|eukprot:XP_012839300.1 PREDICTED: NADP-dependent alkenal double bond reductase P1-like [Erythranthe guttata]
METVTNKYVVTTSNIDGAPNESNFAICEQVVSLKVLRQPAGEGSDIVVVVKNMYVSIDPYQINRMKSYSCSQGTVSAAAALLPGQAINASGVGRVVGSTHPEFKEGDLVSGALIWGEYTLVKGISLQWLQKLDTNLSFPLSYFAGGVLGSSGLTAYGGFFKVCKPKKGDKVFVFAASGSVGSLVGQYAKLFGCYVVGCAGTKQKVDLLKDELGFDDAFNYKQETDLNSALKRYFPEGIDIYFDNVGGEMLEAAINNMNVFGRVSLCGVISEYTDDSKRAKPDMVAVVYKRIKIEGFLSVDFMDIYQEYISTTIIYLQTGELKAVEDISDGLDSIPTAFVDLFRGNNVGKKIVRISQD